MIVNEISLVIQNRIPEKTRYRKGERTEGRNINPIRRR